MKKKMVKILFMVAVCTMLFSMTALAEEKTMPDGMVFDAEYYAQNNPDVVAALGTDENVLYNHYKEHGQAEGRKPYKITEISSSENAVPEGAVFYKAGESNAEYRQFGAIIGLSDMQVFRDIDSVELETPLRYGMLANGKRVNYVQEKVGFSQPGASEVSSVMNYLVGGGGSKISYVKRGPLDYTYYIYKDGIKYQEDVHLKVDYAYLILDTVTCFALGPATAEEIAFVNDRIKRNHELTVQNGGAGGGGFPSVELYEQWYVENWVR